MKNPQIQFTVTPEAASYLKWMAKNILFEKSENAAARHLVMEGLQRARRKHMQKEPPTTQIFSENKPDDAKDD